MKNLQIKFKDSDVLKHKDIEIFKNAIIGGESTISFYISDYLNNKSIQIDLNLETATLLKNLLNEII